MSNQVRVSIVDAQLPGFAYSGVHMQTCVNGHRYLGMKSLDISVLEDALTLGFPANVRERQGDGNKLGRVHTLGDILEAITTGVGRPCKY